MSTLIIFEEPIYIKANDVEKIYPRSKYVMTDLVIEEDDANTAGYLVAVSTDEDSFKELVKLRHYLAENGLDTALLGFYKKSGLTVFTRIVEEEHNDTSPNNLIIFDKPIYIKEHDVRKIYPHSKYLMKDLVIQDDDADTAGYLMAVSTDESSYDELAKLRYKFDEQGLDIALLGIYGTCFRPTVFTRASDKIEKEPSESEDNTITLLEKQLKERDKQIDRLQSLVDSVIEELTKTRDALETVLNTINENAKVITTATHMRNRHIGSGNEHPAYRQDVSDEALINDYNSGKFLLKDLAEKYGMTSPGMRARLIKLGVYKDVYKQKK